MAAPSVRIAEPLKVEAAAYAASIGISLNALVSVALRDYLDARSRSRTGNGAPEGDAREPHAVRPEQPTVMQATSGGSGRVVPKVGRNQPCPCGSGKRYRHCHGEG